MKILMTSAAAMLLVACASVGTHVGECPKSEVASWFVQPTRLDRQESVEEAETRNMHNGVPFGYANPEWLRLKAQIVPGDQLWHFQEPRPPALVGAREGYVVIRNCQTVDQIVLVWD